MQSNLQRTLTVIARIAERDPSTLMPEDELAADLDIGSIEGFQLLIELEKELAIEINDEEAAALESVGDILCLVEERLEE